MQDHVTTGTTQQDSPAINKKPILSNTRLKIKAKHKI